MRMKRSSIALILIQLFMVSTIVGAVSLSVSATHNNANTATGSSEFPEPPITEDAAFDWFNRANDPKLEFVPGEILVKFKTSISVGLTSGTVTTGIESIDRLNKRFEVKEMKRVFSNVYKLKLSEDVDVLSVAREYELSPNVEFAEPNGIYYILSVPNDTEYWRQWAQEVTEAELAWNATIGDPSVLVAVVDTGIDYNHPDLDDNYVALGYDFVYDDDYPLDDGGHGTHCAGIIAAEINNNIGVAGLAQVQIMAEKAFERSGTGSWEDAASGILHAADQGADIISMSFGGYYNSEVLELAVKNASDRGVLLVAAAGNEYTSEKSYPAAYEEVIAVSATNSGEDPAWFTNFGDWIDVAAPGYHIYSTWLGGSYEYASGTSMACPYVAGVAALIKSQFPNMTNVEIRNHLLNTTDDLGTPSFDQIYGYGRVNARWAVDHASSEYDLRLWGMQTSRVLKPGTTTTINCTVLNFGKNKERNVDVQLLVNGNVVENKRISSIELYEWTIVNFSWTPQTEGKYNLTSYVVPKQREDFTNNNALSTRVVVRVEEVVRVPEDFSMIQKAIGASPPGYTIQVSNGTYYERLDIEKSLSLEAKDYGTTVIDPDFRLLLRDIIFVGADNVSISNFSIRNGFSAIVSPGFCFVDKCISHLSINNNVITNTSWAIGLNLTKFTTIIDNSISNNTRGILLNSCNNTSVSGNTMSNNDNWGISTRFPTLIPPGFNSNNSFQGNTVSNNGKGMFLFNTDNSSIVSNTVSNNEGDGIRMEYADYNNVSENWVSNNEWGILLSSSMNNTVYHNNIIDNICQAHASESPSLLNKWDDGYPSGGNYWSDYTGEDNDGDGIGDTSYVIYQNNQDNYPLMWKWFPGDLNGDGDVDSSDFYIFSGTYGSQMGDPYYKPIADLDYDGDVDSNDFFIFSGKYGKSIPY